MVNLIDYDIINHFESDLFKDAVKNRIRMGENCSKSGETLFISTLLCRSLRCRPFSYLSNKTLSEWQFMTSVDLELHSTLGRKFCCLGLRRSGRMGPTLFSFIYFHSSGAGKCSYIHNYINANMKFVKQWRWCGFHWSNIRNFASCRVAD